MAISKEVAVDIIDRFKAVTSEHGDIEYIVAIKNEDRFWNYSINTNSADARIMARLIVQVAKESRPEEDGYE